jgi:large subunit ribosomal protein L18Ae
MKEYQIVGRRSKVPEGQPNKLYRMRIFANNKVIAKSRFWYFLNKLRKLKRTHGEILACHQLHEKKPLKVKNFGIFLRYNSMHGTHNIYKEFRDTTRCGAVKQLYADMASHHRAFGTNIQIMDVREVPNKQVRRKTTVQYLSSKLRFPLLHRVPRVPKRFQHAFMPFRPTTF